MNYTAAVTENKNPEWLTIIEWTSEYNTIAPFTKSNKECAHTNKEKKINNKSQHLSPVPRSQFIWGEIYLYFISVQL